MKIDFFFSLHNGSYVCAAGLDVNYNQLNFLSYVGFISRRSCISKLKAGTIQIYHGYIIGKSV